MVDSLRMQQLARPEQWFARAFYEGAVGEVVVDLSGKLLEVNDAFCRMLDRSREELIDCEWPSVTHPDDRARDLEAVRALVTGPADRDDVYRAEKRYLARDGRAVWADVSVRLLRDERGRPSRFVVKMVDIDDRKRVELALRASEERFRVLADLGAGGDRDRRHRRWIRVRQRSVLRAVWAATGRRARRRLATSAPSRRSGPGSCRSARATPEVRELSTEYRFVHADGSVRWMQLDSAPFRDESGRVLGRIGISTDVTERVLAARQVEQLLDSAPDAIVGVSSDGRIIVTNEQTERLFGYPASKLIGQPVEVLIPERFRDGHRAHRSAYSADPYRRPMGAGLKLFGRREDGTEFPLEISLGPLDTERGAGRREHHPGHHRASPRGAGCLAFRGGRGVVT